MTAFSELVSAAGLSARRYQTTFAETIAGELRERQPVAIAAQAGAGVGKTWALAFAVIEALRAGRRVVWSTQTTLLRAQVLETVQAALAAGGLDDRTTVVERRGRADFASATRTRRLRHALRDRGTEPETLEQLDVLAGWHGPIADFVETHGELRVPQALVCLTASCPEDEQEPYRGQRDAAAAAAVVVQTHALTLIEARFGRLDADLVVFDEADTLPAVAAGAVEMRLALQDLSELADVAGADISAPLQRLREIADARHLTWRDARMADLVGAIRRTLREAATSAPPDLAEAIADTAEELHTFATVDAPKTGAALVHDGSLPLLTVAAVDAVRWLGKQLNDRQVVLLSATLARAEGDDLAKAARALGFDGVRAIDVSPAQFGEMRFRLADRDVPPPFADEGRPADAFFDYAAMMVDEAATHGRTLVLCASYGDVERLVPRLGSSHLAQRRGDKLQPLVEAFRHDQGGVLLTPAAWAGLDLPGLVENVVIIRLPMARPDELRHAVLAHALTRRGLSAENAQNILAAQAREDAMRRLTQGMGRGVRTADDRCTVWIADPRFPLPPSMVLDLRRRLTQGPAQAWQDMAKAIPRRFRTPTGRSAYDRGRIVAMTGGRAVA